jgi:hypothetical protein
LAGCGGCLELSGAGGLRPGLRRRAGTMSAPKVRGKVRVVEFRETPGAPPARAVGGGGTAQALLESILGEGAAGRKRARDEGAGEAGGTTRSAFSRNSAFKEVQELGQTSLHKRDKKRLEAERLAQLGCAPPKGPKMRLKVLFSQRKKHAKRDARIEAEIKASDIVTGKKRATGKSASRGSRADAALPARKREELRQKRIRRNDDIHKVPGGNFHGGVLRLKSTF